MAHTICSDTVGESGGGGRANGTPCILPSEARMVDIDTRASRSSYYWQTKGKDPIARFGELPDLVTF